jgi:hypothetical protein
LYGAGVEEPYNRLVIRRHLRIAVLGLGAALYVWYAAVRHSDSVKARKAARRESARRTLGGP